MCRQLVTSLPISYIRSCGCGPSWGMTGFFLLSGVPLLRRQALAKCFRWDAAPRHSWHVEDAAMHQGEAAILGPQRYLCPRCWKPQVLRRVGTLNSEMALSDSVCREICGPVGESSQHHETKVS